MTVNVIASPVVYDSLEYMILQSLEDMTSRIGDKQIDEKCQSDLKYILVVGNFYIEFIRSVKKDDSEKLCCQDFEKIAEYCDLVDKIDF